MKILLVTPLFFPYPGGASVYFDLLSRSLAEKGEVKRIYVLTRYITAEKLAENEAKVCILRCLPNFRSRSIFLRYAERILTPLVMLILSRLLGIQLVHYHSITSYKAIHYLSCLFGVPLICDIRDLAVRNERASLLYYRLATRIICSSENICDFICSDENLKTKCVSVPIPFEFPLKQSENELTEFNTACGLEPSKPYICFAGAIIEYKGIFDLLGAFKILLSKGYGWQLVFAGPMELSTGSPEYRTFLSEIKTPGVFYLGPLNHKRTLCLIQGCSVFALPSRTEGLPRTCLEAISLGVKVILPGCVPEFRRHCPGFVLDCINPQRLADKIIEVSKSDRRPEYPFSCHDPDAVADRTYRLYVDTLSPNTRKGESL
ncbi:MAG: glycosyltransferase family 4 protein [Deltaproteobacteria bacterium]|nr:glycosyltransferase family 4 protein [Deltaproteobacteria bacterium]